MAALISIGNLGGIASSNIFMASEEPEYWTGYGVCLGLVLVAIAAALILRYSFSKDNQRKEAMTEEEVRETFSESELMALGDRSPLFKYTL